MVYALSQSGPLLAYAARISMVHPQTFGRATSCQKSQGKELLVCETSSYEKSGHETSGISLTIFTTNKTRKLSILLFILKTSTEAYTVPPFAYALGSTKGIWNILYELRVSKRRYYVRFVNLSAISIGTW